MFENIENLKIENILKGTSKSPASVIDRKIHTFVLRTGGCVRYSFAEQTFDVHPGEIIFLPKGSTYDFISLEETPCTYIAIRFEADLTRPTPCVHPFDSFHEAEEFINNLTDLWKFGGKNEHYKCYSVFYSLLAYIENIQSMTYIDKKKHYIISPAVSYLKKHIYDCDLKIDTLIRLCGISGTYFQKIFQSKFSVSPQKYILAKRLSHAKAIIDSGDFDTISEIAACVGYNDPLYFSRAFKKKYGVSPSRYAKNG